MSKDLLNILANSNKDIDNQKLMDYLSGKLSQQEQHEIEKEMAGNELVNDAVEGLENAKDKMKRAIVRAVYKDIGGDEQKIKKIDSTYSNVALKYIMLPVWLSSYVYEGKTYRFAINGHTGKVGGEYPESAIKKTLAGCFGVLLFFLFMYLLYKIYNAL